MSDYPSAVYIQRNGDGQPFTVVYEHPLTGRQWRQLKKKLEGDSYYECVARLGHDNLRIFVSGLDLNSRLLIHIRNVVQPQLKHNATATVIRQKREPNEITVTVDFFLSEPDMGRVGKSKIPQLTSILEQGLAKGGHGKLIYLGWYLEFKFQGDYRFHGHPDPSIWGNNDLLMYLHTVLQPIGVYVDRLEEIFITGE